MVNDSAYVPGYIKIVCCGVSGTPRRYVIAAVIVLNGNPYGLEAAVVSFPYTESTRKKFPVDG